MFKIKDIDIEYNAREYALCVIKGDLKSRIDSSKLPSWTCIHAPFRGDRWKGSIRSSYKAPFFDCDLIGATVILRWDNGKPLAEIIPIEDDKYKEHGLALINLEDIKGFIPDKRVKKYHEDIKEAAKQQVNKPWWQKLLGR